MAYVCTYRGQQAGLFACYILQSSDKGEIQEEASMKAIGWLVVLLPLASLCNCSTEAVRPAHLETIYSMN